MSDEVKLSTIDEAEKIFIRYLPELPKEVQAAVKFTLKLWKKSKFISNQKPNDKMNSENAKIFLAGLPALPNNRKTCDETFIAKIDSAYYAIRADETIWYPIKNLPHEIWRDVVDYEGIYQVSNYGRVKSFNYGRVKILRQSINTQNYFVVSLYNKKPTKVGVHVLVGTAFIQNPENKPIIHHQNDIKADNCIWNLCWATYSENIQWAWESGARKFSPIEKNPNSKLTPEQVRYIRQNYIAGDRKFGAHALARKFNVNKSVILNVVKGKTYKNVV